MKVIIFARAATVNQNDRSSLDAQIKECREYAKAKGLKVLKVYKFISKVKSFTEFINFIDNEKGKITIIISDWNRIFRDYALFHFLRDANIEIHCVRENCIMDLSKSENLFFCDIVNSAITYERNIRKERRFKKVSSTTTKGVKSEK